MSFHEKSAWACLAAILLVFVPFFVVVFAVPGYPIVIPAFIGWTPLTELSNRRPSPAKSRLVRPR